MTKSRLWRKGVLFCLLLLFWLSLVFPYMMLSYRMSGGSQMAYMVEHNLSAEQPLPPVGFFTPHSLRNWKSAVFSEYLYGKVTLFFGPEALREYSLVRLELEQSNQAQHYLELTNNQWALLWYLGEGDKAVPLENIPQVEEMAKCFDPVGGPRSSLIDLRYYFNLWARIALTAPAEAVTYGEYGFLLDVLPAVLISLAGLPFIAPAGVALALLPRLLCPIFLLVYGLAGTYLLGRKLFTA